MGSRVVLATGMVLMLAGAAVATPVLAVGWSTPTSETMDRSSSSIGKDVLSTANRMDAGTPEQATATVADRSNGTSESTVNISYTYRRLPEQPMVVEVTMRLDAAASIDGLGIQFRNESTVLEATGLARNGTTYELNDGSTAEVVYRTPINSTFLGTTGDSWTLVGHLPPTINTGSGIHVVENVFVDGEGYVANSAGAGYTPVLIGEHDIYRRTIDNETIELVVPAGVSLLYGPERTIEALANASRSLDVGGANGVVSAIATPEIVEGYSREEPVNTAIQPGESLILVEAEATLSAWIHEYVHTRQPYKPAAENMRWLSEGSARYYEVLLSVEQGHENWRTLGEVFEQAADENGVLAEPDTWSGLTAYAKGALVLAAIDREIRLATNGKRTLQDVLRRVNGANSTLTVDEFIRIVRDVGGDTAATTARKYTTTRALPDGVDTFASVYGYEDAEIQYRITALNASGPRWNRSLKQGDSVRIGVNETFRITARISNVGEAPALARLGPLISSGESSLERVDSPWVGRLAPGETVTRSATHRFDRPGTYKLGVGPALSPFSVGDGQILTVEVVPNRDTASIVELNATSNATTDGPVDVAVRIRNDGSQSTFLELPVRVGGDQVSTLTLVLDGGETRTVTIQVAAPAGQDSPTVAVGNAETIVGSTPVTTTSSSETESTPTGQTGSTVTASDSTETTSPGFGVVAVLAALIVLAVLTQRNDATKRR